MVKKTTEKENFLIILEEMSSQFKVLIEELQNSHKILDKINQQMENVKNIVDDISLEFKSIKRILSEIKSEFPLVEKRSLNSFKRFKNGSLAVVPMQLRDKDQAYYWAPKAQKEIALVMKEIKAGKGKKFKSVKELREYLGD